MMMKSKPSRSLCCLAAVLAVALLGVCALSSATSLAASPEFRVDASVPSFAEPGEPISITVNILNVGSARSHAPIVLSDTVGSGLSTPTLGNAFFSTVSYSVIYPETSEENSQYPSCSASGATLSCTIEDSLPPGAQLSVRMESSVAPEASGSLVNEVSVGAADVPAQTSRQDVTVGEGPFAISAFTATLLDAQRQPLTQAAAVPAEFTTNLHFTTTTGRFFGIAPITSSVEHFKDVTVHLPAGLIGNPTAAAVCTADELATVVPNNENNSKPLCPTDSQVGVARIELAGSGIYNPALYNMVAPPGAATQLAFEFSGTIVTLDAYVRAGDHGIDVVSRDTSTTLPITEVQITPWGDPASPSHDRVRGNCLYDDGAGGRTCHSNAAERSFLRMPTSCSGEGLPFGAESNSYEHQASVVSKGFAGPAMTGCENVPFSPTIFTQPTATAADSPTGVAVQLSLPQSSNPKGLSSSDLKKAVVTLPEGMTLNPSSADGLQACDDAHLRLASNEPATCPDAAKVGTVVLKTPLLESPVEGFIWLRTQNSSDPMSGEMFRLAIELRDDRHGIDIKLPGQVAANPVTGRLTSTFDDAPQLPFSDMTLHFKSGARAPLTTPFSCQEQTTEADLYPWARPDVPVHKKMTFQLTSGPEGLPCQAARPFNPGFNAGVGSVQAGGFTPFLATFSRKDVDQSMQRVSVRMPKGLLGSLIGLPLCGEAQANAGTCSPASEIGSVTAGAGDGPTPFYVTGGHVYMTQGYEGAPFGLSVVVPAKAGPFDLGQVVVRAKVEVDIHTAQLTVTTDPLPQIVGGVPVNLRLVNVTINRPDFTYNPTNCNPSEVSGTMTGGQGAIASLSNHFQVTNCGALTFKPKFSVSTPGKTSRKAGAGLAAKLLYPRGPQGTQANIAKVKVSLPKQLPSRLTTLQKACDAATFDTNPAACPAASRIGIAKANTPVLPVELTGPVYFVSHGGEAFPDLVVVLQGYGVTVNLVGTTFISKAGITSTTFKEVPDVPVGSFELKLPQGPNSALAANGNLCASKLVMPTIFIAQDGEEIKTNTKITATGCTKHKTHKKHKHKKHKKK
jgi:hypothetical protein